MWHVYDLQNTRTRIATCLLLLAAFLSSAWFMAAWAEQSRGLSFGPVFTVFSLLQIVVALGVLAGEKDDPQRSHGGSMREHSV